MRGYLYLEPSGLLREVPHPAMPAIQEHPALHVATCGGCNYPEAGPPPHQVCESNQRRSAVRGRLLALLPRPKCHVSQRGAAYLLRIAFHAAHRILPLVWCCSICRHIFCASSTLMANLEERGVSGAPSYNISSFYTEYYRDLHRPMCIVFSIRAAATRSLQIWVCILNI